MSKIFRQGDVLLKEISNVQGKQIAKGKHTLAFGEVTGHHHDIVGDVGIFQSSQEQTNDTLVGEGNGNLCVVIGDNGATLTHQEHDYLQIPKGIYKVVMQREYDVVEGIRAVLD